MRYTLQQIKDGTGFRKDATFEEVETCNGWTNRETWAVALHINNDQGWQESVLEALREADVTQWNEQPNGGMAAHRAGQVIRDNVEDTLSPLELARHGERTPTFSEGQWNAIRDIGSMWRVNWSELGASFLSDLEEG